MTKEKIFTVSQFINKINEQLKPLSRFVVEGEVSEFNVSRQEWINFKLQDEEAEEYLISCFTRFSNLTKWNLKGVLEDGMKVRLKGSVKQRKKNSFGIYVKEMDLAGEGTLKKAYEKLKKKLKKQGLFAEERKRSLPEFPQRIGLITSKDARAYTDFLKGLKARMGGLDVFHLNVHVQGKNAIPEIVSAFDYFEREDLGLDLIVLVRGGGRLEDLQAFNSEKVARAVFSSEVPVVCGVGHEDDVTLAGLSCDLRASTPSNTAELIIPSREELRSEVNNLLYKVRTSFEDIIDNNYEEVDDFIKVGRNFYQRRIHRLENLLLKFSRTFATYKRRLEQTDQQIERWAKSNGKNIHLKIKDAKQFIQETMRLLKSFSPREVLKRGYSIVKKEGNIIKNAQNLKVDDSVEVQLYQGGFKSLIKKIKE